MGAISIVGFGSFVVASLMVGLRLLGIAMRTGKAPELAIGTAFLAGGGLGYGLVVLAFGIWRIFRPADRWPIALMAMIVALLAVSLVGRLRNVAMVPGPTFVFWSFTIGSGASYAWSGFESLRFHAMSRRRTRIGLADGDIAQRFLLWGVAGSATVGIHVCSAANRFLERIRSIPRC